MVVGWRKHLREQPDPPLLSGPSSADHGTTPRERLTHPGCLPSLDSIGSPRFESGGTLSALAVTSTSMISVLRNNGKAALNPCVRWRPPLLACRRKRHDALGRHKAICWLVRPRRRRPRVYGRNGLYLCRATGQMGSATATADPLLDPQRSAQNPRIACATIKHVHPGSERDLAKARPT